ncbi:hypothetical protein [Flavobacterium sp. FlaQc-50]|jgi:hypothetical protein|uniref:hypothetical protein n=1 Tax=unclassified Flavobacterium TaxID=196869 RepID=UPI003757B45B
MEEINIGVTLLFKKNTKVVSGILKSTVVTSTKADLKNNIDNRANEISKLYNYKFIGINDVFFVSGQMLQGEILGRTTDYDLDSFSKAKSIVSTEFSFDKSSKSKQFNCSLVYFCKNFNNDKFAISIITVLDSLTSSVIRDANHIANDISFIEKIKTNSIEKIESIKYLGIEDIGEVELEFGIFQSFYAEFNNEESLKGEIISKDEMSSKLNDILEGSAPQSVP